MKRKKKPMFPSLASVIMPKGESLKLLKRTPQKLTDTTSRMLKLGTDVLIASTMMSVATMTLGTVAQVAARS